MLPPGLLHIIDNNSRFITVTGDKSLISTMEDARKTKTEENAAKLAQYKGFPFITDVIFIMNTS